MLKECHQVQQKKTPDFKSRRNGFEGANMAFESKNFKCDQTPPFFLKLATSTTINAIRTDSSTGKPAH
jgi:hypothetical protein